MLAGVAFPGWHAHVDSWALVVLLEVAYLVIVRREATRRPAEAPAPATRGQVVAFTAGVATLWLASDWPVHDLAEGYLYSVHMVQHLLMTLVAALLLVVGTPDWLARRILRPDWLLRCVRVLARPVPALIQFNLVLVLSHWPVVVEATLHHHVLHFLAHAVLLVSALLMWLPVASPLPEVPRLAPVVQMLYLFLQTIVPTIPASFLTFGSSPLYDVYETFPRLWGISALSDQQVAGLIMKIGGGLFLWMVIGVVFFRWYAREEKESTDEVLTWDQVERELQALDRQSRAGS